MQNVQQLYHRLVQSKLKWLLYPVSLIYGAIISFRNLMYERKVFQSVKFQYPVIAIGNLNIGGSGKTPMTEFILNSFDEEYTIAVLSRGYGRKSSGFIMADHASGANEIGDEPRQIKRKFPYALVAVAEDRMLAIPNLLMHNPGIDMIVLDDAFQHRSVRAGLNVLLTDYKLRYTHDHLLPVGMLREQAASAKRADRIIITKCPEALSREEMESIRSELAPEPYQAVYFAKEKHLVPYSIFNDQRQIPIQKEETLLFFAGIAQPISLLNHLKGQSDRVLQLEFRDHKQFDRFDLELIRDSFGNVEFANKRLITTEKDAARLEVYREWFVANRLELWVVPVKTEFFGNQGLQFQEDIKLFVEVTKKRLYASFA